jgi:hypothetical protein
MLFCCTPAVKITVLDKRSPRVRADPFFRLSEPRQSSVPVVPVRHDIVGRRRVSRRHGSIEAVRDPVILSQVPTATVFPFDMKFLRPLLVIPFRRPKLIVGRQLRAIFRRLSATSRGRLVLKSFSYRILLASPKNTASYRHWLEGQQFGADVEVGCRDEEQLSAITPPQMSPARESGLVDAAAGLALPFAEDPEVSILMPVHNQAGFTLCCLQSIAAAPPRASVENIVIDDAATDETPELLRSVTGGKDRYPSIVFSVRRCRARTVPRDDRIPVRSFWAQRLSSIGAMAVHAGRAAKSIESAG